MLSYFVCDILVFTTLFCSLCLSKGDAIRGAFYGADQNGFGFSTPDRDNDGCDPHCVFGDVAVRDCSSKKGGGWWFGPRCGSAALNGLWHPAGNNIGWGNAVDWRTWRGPAPYSARATRMMIKSVAVQGT